MEIDIERLVADETYWAQLLQEARDESWEEFQKAKCQESSEKEIEAMQSIWNYAFAKASQTIADLQIRVAQEMQKRNKKD